MQTNDVWNIIKFENLLLDAGTSHGSTNLTITFLVSGGSEGVADVSVFPSLQLLVDASYSYPAQTSSEYNSSVFVLLFMQYIAHCSADVIYK